MCGAGGIVQQQQLRCPLGSSVCTGISSAGMDAIRQQCGGDGDGDGDGDSDTQWSMSADGTSKGF